MCGILSFEAGLLNPTLANFVTTWTIAFSKTLTIYKHTTTSRVEVPVYPTFPSCFGYAVKRPARYACLGWVQAGFIPGSVKHRAQYHAAISKCDQISAIFLPIARCERNIRRPNEQFVRRRGSVSSTRSSLNPWMFAHTFPMLVDFVTVVK